MTDEAPRLALRPNPVRAQQNGLDDAIISALEDEMASAFDVGLLNRGMLTTALGVLHETLRGGPLMAYFATLKAEAALGMAALPALDPTNALKIMEVQQAIGRFDHLIEWMKGYIAVAPGHGPADSAEPPPEDA